MAKQTDTSPETAKAKRRAAEAAEAAEDHAATVGDESAAPGGVESDAKDASKGAEESEADKGARLLASLEKEGVVGLIFASGARVHA